MLKKLRYKFTLICALITVAVLMLTVSLLFISAKRELKNYTQYALNTELNTLTVYLHTSCASTTSHPKINHTWLSELASSNNSLIYLEENHKPLRYNTNFHNTEYLNALISEVKDVATTTYNFNFYAYSSLDDPHPNKKTFEIKTSTNKHYLVAVSSIITTKTNYQIAILVDMYGYDQKIKKQLTNYIILFLFSAILLTFFSFWFSGLAIIPIAKNEAKQKEFVAAASHELRSPLTVLNTNFTALSSEYPVITNSLFYHSVLSECKRMAKLINDLLFLSHADTKHNWTLDTKETPLDTLLLEIYDRYELTSMNHRHILHLNLPEEAFPSYNIDPERITQVIDILIDNALSYTPEGSTITLSLIQQSEHEIRISVIDNGPGIEMQHKEHIFDRFYRVDASRHKKDHLGLGLSIAYEIVNLHKGRLILEDTLPHGCTFHIMLPV